MGSDILTFEEFREWQTVRLPLPNDDYVELGGARYQNEFSLFWSSDPIFGPSRRKEEVYRRFKRSHPDLDQRIFEHKAKGMENHEKGTRFLSEEGERDLYEAYKIMRKNIKSNRELFFYS